MSSRVLACLALVVSAACSADRPAPTAVASDARLNQSRLGADVNTELAALRRATASFHDPAAADRAGWSVPITPCMDGGAAGAMGFHVGNGGLINDGVAVVEKPEALLYEPGPNGTRRLVGVEYIIPYSFVPRDATPPVLFGRQFAQVDAFQVWGLHAWVWADNPSGTFAPYNPRVSCAYASTSSSMRHH
jgi:hypothetical protein